MSYSNINDHPIIDAIAERAGSWDGDSDAFKSAVVEEIERLRRCLAGVASCSSCPACAGAARRTLEGAK